MITTTNGVQIRWMIRRDLASVMQIATQSFVDAMSENDLMNYLRNNNVIAKVAETEDQRIIGYIFYELHKDRLHIQEVGIDPLHRRKGIGRLFVWMLKSKLDITRRHEITAEVNEYNLPAQLWLRECGFKASLIEGSVIHFRYQLEGV